MVTYDSTKIHAHNPKVSWSDFKDTKYKKQPNHRTNVIPRVLGNYAREKAIYPKSLPEIFL